MTTLTPSTPGWATKVSRQWRSSGLPARGRNCFGTSPPSRMPLPAATTNTITPAMVGFSYPSRLARKLVRRRRFAKAAGRHHNAAMQANLIPQFAALVAMLPLTAAAVTARLGRNLLLWLLLAAALAGPAALVLSEIHAGWQAGLSPNLWATIAATLLVFAVLCLVRPGAYRLGGLLLPYL